MKIVTLTLNPAFDIHCHTPNFQPFHENLAHITAIDAGGKGINISRALTNMGVENTALVVLGEENADSFRRSLTADNIQFCEISVGGRIRENITLHTENTPETRISFAGFTVDDTLLKAVEQRLNELIDGNAILTVTGRNLEGLSMDALKDMLIRFRKKGVKLIVDSRSFSLQDLLDVRPWLIKPNEEEIGMYRGLKMAVLCNGSTASAAEVFTATMQDYGLATVVGTKTFGKGVMQSTKAIPFQGEIVGYVKLTTHAYHTKRGAAQSYHGVGIAPDIQADLSAEAKSYALKLLPQHLDDQLKAAVATLTASNQ